MSAGKSRQISSNSDEIRQTAKDRSNYIRALEILGRMSLEQRGWKALFRRWRYAQEPLRNDAARLVEEVGYAPGHPIDSEPLK